MKNVRLLGYKNSVRTSQETQYVSATDRSRLMLCKICSFNGGNYEECRLLGYKNPVRTSQVTLRPCCRAQPVNAMYSVGCTEVWEQLCNDNLKSVKELCYVKSINNENLKDSDDGA
jgi:hypothetical protein